MNSEALQEFVASVPGSMGDHMARHMAVNMIAAGSVDHAAALTGLVGPALIPVLIEAGVPLLMIRAAIHCAVLYRYHDLRSIDRAAFAGWCRTAGFVAPSGTPEMVDLYRGTVGVSPIVAAAGWHWSLEFDDAAYYAARFADAALTGALVVHARVPRDGIAVFITGNAHQEVIPVGASVSYGTITDHQRIGNAAVRAAHRYQALKAQGWKETGTEGVAEAAAIAAASVEPGTAIVGKAPATQSSTGSAMADAFIERARMKLATPGAFAA